MGYFLIRFRLIIKHVIDQEAAEVQHWHYNSNAQDLITSFH